MKVGVSVGIQESPHKLVEVVHGYLDLGYRRVKINIKPGVMWQRHVQSPGIS